MVAGVIVDSTPTSELDMRISPHPAPDGSRVTGNSTATDAHANNVSQQ